MDRTLVVAPHADDETLGVGGTILRRKSEGSRVGWLIITSVSVQNGWSESESQKREQEIADITKFYSFDDVFRLEFTPAGIDMVPMRNIVSTISDIVADFMPTEIFIPHGSDVHSDHRIVSQAVISASKWFRNPSVKRLLAYETLSETDFGTSDASSFRPNVYFDISPYLDQKLSALHLYESQLGEHPYPRSIEGVRSLAAVRGLAAGFMAAEAFELIRDRS